MRNFLFLVAVSLDFARPAEQVPAPNKVIDLRITEETTPLGELAIVKIYASEPVALTHVEFSIRFAGGDFSYSKSPLVSGRIFSVFDDATGAVSLDLFNGAAVWVQVDSPRGGVGRVPNLPIVQLAFRAKQELSFSAEGTGQIAPNGRSSPGIPLRFNPGKIHVGGLLAVQLVSPNGLEGLLPAGTPIRIRGTGLTPDVLVNLEGLQVVSRMVSANELEFTLPVAADLAGRRLRLSAASGEVLDYWLGQGDTLITVPGPVSASGYSFQPLDFLHARRLVFENPTQSAVSVQVTNAFTDQTGSGGLTPAEMVSGIIPAGGQWAAIPLPQGRSTFTTDANIPVKVTHFLVGKNGGPYIFSWGTADPVLDGLAPPRIQRVQNGASGELATIAPGQILTLFGMGLGPDVGTSFTQEGDGIPTTLANAKVMVGSFAAPLLYVSANQINFLVPYEIPVNQPVSIVAEVNGRRSAPYPVDVAKTNPGLFTQSGSGVGPAAALNQDNQLNLPGAPARRGEVVQLFLTGTGATSPAATTGSLAGAEPGLVALPVRVWIGGVQCPALYAGTSAGSVTGLTQVNVLVSPETPIGDAIPVAVEVDGRRSPFGPTLAIR